ncbi:DUF4270 domain-containing protein [Aureibaculum sp. 2210JD6-5]|uniref:DUF4270 domain-containing protein n=1 Tax=Aureibaculum sp. 2210JD6-5 TaxID=3103957 RepID=UPI002AAE715E|nr:DUF4270 domain-containing protein [Aureibaculum sp. 2210JD6-5]MDY7396826.1 DUF4270 domain-containing protein [Aureibaculum sp. 2210JD6-5]
MTTKIVNSIKYIAIFSIVLMSVISCEKDFQNVGVGLVDNNLFATEQATFEVIAYNQNVDSSRISSSNPHLLGVTKDKNFGLLKASIIGQLSLGSINFTDNMSIDAVILNIPYYATKKEGAAGYELDSIIGDQETEFNLSVYENGTYLNTLDPTDPSQGKKYYSDETYVKKSLLYSDGFKPNKNDTIYIVERRFLDGDPDTVDDRDTIMTETATPSIKIPLDTVFFRNSFINQQNSGAFDSNDNFINHFRGLILEADGTDGSLMTLPMNNATMTFYYSNIVLTDESTTTGDLNGDGDTDDEDVPVKTKQTASFPLSGLKTGTYERDYTKAQPDSDINTKLTSPDKENGEDKLYIQGAAGSITIIDILKGMTQEKLDQIRSENWLINDASLTLYVENENDTIIPHKLHIYNYEENTQILDASTEPQTLQFNGALQKTEDNKPLKYKFTITDYISEVLKSDNPLNLQKLAIKVFHPTDLPNIPQNGPITDIIMRDFSWNAKGVVLKGNNYESSSDGYAQRLKLEIFYTTNNE